MAVLLFRTILNILNWRLMGSRDATDVHGRVNFVTRLNLKFAEYAQTRDKEL